jgi:hypothetical protein
VEASLCQGQRRLDKGWMKRKIPPMGNRGMPKLVELGQEGLVIEKYMNFSVTCLYGKDITVTLHIISHSFIVDVGC